MTLEEEEDTTKTNTETEKEHHLETEAIDEVNDPNEDKILEEDDWMLDGEGFDVEEDDLMEEEQLLYEDDLKEGEIGHTMAAESAAPAVKNPSETSRKKKNDEKRKNDELSDQIGETTMEYGDSRDHQSPLLSLKSPFKRKKGSPSVAGLSLRKMNLLKGRASPKTKEANDGLNPGSKPTMARTFKSEEGGRREALEKIKTKNAKVGSKPPKIPK